MEREEKLKFTVKMRMAYVFEKMNNWELHLE